MTEKDVYSELASIRNLMERSSKFISLSGLSGVLAGVYALVGSYIATKFCTPGAWWGRSDQYETVDRTALIGIAVIVLAASLSTGVLLSVRKADKAGQGVWNPVSRRFLTSMLIPLITGGLFILGLLVRGEVDIIAPACLIFYGLALVSGSQFTYSDIKWLGFLEIGLGLVAVLYPGFGLLFWNIGFGLLHILYGTIMHVKYDR